MSEIDILPPEYPGGKFRMVAREPGVPLVEPPKVCIMCEEEHRASAFTPMGESRSPICDHCKRPAHVRGLPWSEDVRWADRVMYDDAMVAVKLIEMETKHGR